MTDPHLVERLGALAAIALSEDERRALAEQLPQILAYIDQLRAVDTTAVGEAAAVGPEAIALRDDVPGPSLSAAEALANAPTRLADRFLVPAWRERE